MENPAGTLSVVAATCVLGDRLDTTPRPGRRNRRFAAAERSADIVRAATLLIGERGYYGVSLQEVATACGVTVAGLLHHFPNKAALLIAVLENRDRADLNQAQIDAAKDEDFTPNPRERLDALVRRNSLQPELVRLYTILNSESLAPGHPAHQYYNDRYEYSIGLIAKMLRGHFADPLATASQFISIMDGIQMQWLRFPGQHELMDLWKPLADKVFANQL